MTLWEPFLEALVTVGKVSAIVIPLTVAYQVLRDNRTVRGRLGPFRGVFKHLGLGEGAAVPLAAGLVLGIVYGAGILIQEARAGRMAPRELFLLAFFLCTCHAVIEDTLLFVVVGGDGIWILAPRLVLAVVATALVSRWLARAAQP